MAEHSSPKKGFRLPNAPLAEVVFELRWALVGPSELPLQLHTDPGFLPALDAFSSEAAKLGFSTKQDMSSGPQIVAHAIARRFYVGAEQPFPLLQLGPGIFASNQSSDYDWPSFKQQTIKGVRALLNAYPVLPSYPLTPTHLELRYIDVFDRSLLATTDFIKFTRLGTNLEINLPEFFESEIFEPSLSGRFVCRVPVRGQKATLFSVDLASASRKKDDIVRLESKVVSIGEGVPSAKAHPPFLKALDRWLEDAHNVTSPFFQKFVTEKLMSRFGGS